MIEEDYRKLGPIKWGLVYVVKWKSKSRWRRSWSSKTKLSVFFSSFFFFFSSFAQGSIAFFFVLFSVLLFTRDPKFVTGWSVFFKKGWETFSSLLISKKIKETKSLLTWTWTCPLFSGTSRTPSQVWSSSPCCSSSPRRNLPCAGGSTLKVSELNCTALKRN